MLKPKIFVRYPAGGCGHFLSLVILALQIDRLDLIESLSGHSQSGEIYVGHNFDQQWDLGIDTQLSTQADTNVATSWLLDNFQFTETARKFYVVHTHAHIFKPILNVWPESKIVTINCNKLDLPQLAFNFVSKAGNSHSDRCIAARLLRIQKKYKTLRVLNGNNPMHINMIRQNLKLFTYIILHSWQELHEIYYDTPTTGQLFSLTFRDIYHGNYTNFLDNLIDFLNFNVSTKNYQKVIAMIQRYASAQQSIPWELPVDCYT